MNSLLTALVLLLLIRFVVLKEGERLSGKEFLASCGLFPVAFISCIEGLQLAALLSGSLIVLHGLLYIGERRLGRASPALRTVSLIVALSLAYGPFVSLEAPELRFEFLEHLSTEGLALSTAALLCLKESNFAIRWFFRHYRLIEKVKALSDAPSTDNGRIIGNLERLLLLMFLWQDAALAATFIVAVKGLARFKKMEEHQAFAEYVIIGTFLSVLITLLVYQATHRLY